MEINPGVTEIKVSVKLSTGITLLAPLGPPHMIDEEEDEFRVYRILKGSILIASVQCFYADPAVYPDPESFHPERFLDQKAT